MIDTKHHKVGIVIVNFNGSSHTYTLLESILHLTGLDCVFLSIAIVDNGSGDDELFALREMVKAVNHFNIDIILIGQDNIGYAGGVNRGLKELAWKRVDWYWVLNNDTVLDNNCIHELLSEANKSDLPTLFGATLIYLDDKKTIQAAGGARYFSAFALASHNLKGKYINECVKTESGKIDYIVGASIFFSHATLELIGLMPEEYFLYYEETEWCLSAARKGARMAWVDTAIVYHAEGAATGANNKFNALNNFTAYYLWRNSLWLTRKLWPYWLPIVLFTKLLELALALIRGERRKVRIFCHAFVDFALSRMGKSERDFH